MEWDGVFVSFCLCVCFGPSIQSFTPVTSIYFYVLFFKYRIVDRQDRCVRRQEGQTGDERTVPTTRDVRNLTAVVSSSVRMGP